MKIIPLTRGYFTFVNDEDFDYLNQWKWQYTGGYAARGVKIPRTRRNKTILMHHVILNTSSMVDHLDRNKLNNQRSNLRLATRADNNRNQGLRKDNASGYKGVSKYHGKWAANIQVDGSKQVFLGGFTDPEEAAYVYDKFAMQLFGDFAYLNLL